MAGYLRSSESTNASPNLTRMGASTYAYDGNDFWKCANLDAFFYDWYECAESGTAGGSQVVSGSLHSGPHAQIGGKSGTNRGDFEDVATSPNEPLFFFHHANVDRNELWWMQKNAAKRSSYYGFPAEKAIGIGPYSSMSYIGQNLLDVVSSTWGFTASDLGLSSATDLLTNADVLCQLSPSTAPYTYDSHVACLADASACTAVWEGAADDSGATQSTTTGAITTANLAVGRSVASAAVIVLAGFLTAAVQ